MARRRLAGTLKPTKCTKCSSRDAAVLNIGMRIYVCVWLGMYSSYAHENDWTYAMTVNFVVQTNLGLGSNICMSLGMRMGPRMKNNMAQRRGRSFITASSLADLSLAALRLTALSLAPIDLEISTRILLLPDKLKYVSRGVRTRENY